MRRQYLLETSIAHGISRMAYRLIELRQNIAELVGKGEESKAEPLMEEVELIRAQAEAIDSILYNAHYFRCYEGNGRDEPAIGGSFMLIVKFDGKAFPAERRRHPFLPKGARLLNIWDLLDGDEVADPEHRAWCMGVLIDSYVYWNTEEEWKPLFKDPRVARA